MSFDQFVSIKDPQVKDNPTGSIFFLSRRSVSATHRRYAGRRAQRSLAEDERGLSRRSRAPGRMTSCAMSE